MKAFIVKLKQTKLVKCESEIFQLGVDPTLVRHGEDRPFCFFGKSGEDKRY